MRLLREPAAPTSVAPSSGAGLEADPLRALLEGARAGEREAFRSLYLALHGPVARFVARRVRSRADAEDLVSRVFFSLLRRLDDFDARRGSVLAFAITIARSTVIAHVRGAREAVPLDDLDAVLTDGAGSALDVLIEDEERAELARLVRGLPADMREMFALRYGDGLKHAEIAGVLGLDVAAVKQRFSRALRGLRERLERAGPREANERHEEEDDEEERARGAEGAVIDVG